MPNLISYGLSSGVSNIVSVPLPTGVSSGNFLLGIVRSNNSGNHNIPSGWTQIGSEFFVNDYINNICAGAVFYRNANGLDSGYSITIDSGKYVGTILNVNQTTGIDNYQILNSGQGCSSTILYGQKLNYSGELQLDIILGLTPLLGATLGGYEAPFNGLYHSGVSLYVNVTTVEYPSGNYSPPSFLIRASGSEYQNSGQLYYYPGGLYYAGMSLGLKP